MWGEGKQIEKAVRRSNKKLSGKIYKKNARGDLTLQGKYNICGND
jgi:hypothetical protein